MECCNTTKFLCYVIVVVLHLCGPLTGRPQQTVIIKQNDASNSRQRVIQKRPAAQDGSTPRKSYNKIANKPALQWIVIAVMCVCL